MTEPLSPWLLVAVAFVATFVWRAGGVVLSGRIQVDTPLFEWFQCVTQALVGGLMVRALLFPSTALDQVPLTDRVIAVAVGLVVFLIMRRHVLGGVLAGVLVIAGSVVWRGGV